VSEHLAQMDFAIAPRQRHHSRRPVGHRAPDYAQLRPSVAAREFDDVADDEVQ
jgi:hypothetical protein